MIVKNFTQFFKKRIKSMQSIKNIKAVFFSPTGNTKRVVELIAGRLAQKLSVPVESDDFTLPAAHIDTRTYSPEDLVIFGVPTYAGRIPNNAECRQMQYTPSSPCIKKKDPCVTSPS